MAVSTVIRASAPGRAGILGNPTDGYGGTVISSSVAERAWCELAPSDVWKLRIGQQTQEIHSKDDLEIRGDDLDVARSVLLALWPVPPAALVAGTDIPMRAGLSGSTAILASILGAVLEHLERSLSRYEIAELARTIEFNIMNITCGFQDQYMIVFGGQNYMDFRLKEPGAPDPHPFATVEPLPLHEAGCSLILGHTGVQRISGSVHKGLRERWIDGEEAVVEGYLEIARMAREGKKAILRGDWLTVGKLMNDNHAIQRDLGGSGESNEALIKAALDAGALGAKLAGAGKGGTIIALCDEADRVKAAIDAAGADRVWPLIPSPGLQVERCGGVGG